MTEMLMTCPEKVTKYFKDPDIAKKVQLYFDKIVMQ